MRTTVVLVRFSCGHNGWASPWSDFISAKRAALCAECTSGGSEERETRWAVGL